MSKRAGNPLPKRDKGHLPGGLFALGEHKLKGRGEKAGISGGGTSPTVSGQPQAKKPKFSQQAGGPTGSSVAKAIFSDPVRLPAQPQPAPAKPSSTVLSDVAPSALVASVERCLKDGDRTGAGLLVQAAVGSLRDSRVKPDPVLNSALAALVAKQPGMFSAPTVVEGLVGVLKKEQTLVFKLKTNPSPLIVAAQLLTLALSQSKNWPESLAVAYVNDAVGPRVWADLEECGKLVDNILTVFHTTPSSGTTGAASLGEGSAVKWEVPAISVGAVSVEPRWSPSVEASVQTHCLQSLQEQLKKPQHNDALTRSLLLFLSTASGWSEVRVMAAQRLEGWMQNPKLSRLCQELLQALSANTRGAEGEDRRVVELLVGMRLRSKALATPYLSCIREVIQAHPDYLEVAMRTILANELSPARNTGNMQIIVAMVTDQKDRSAKVLADVFLQALVGREDCQRSLRALLRETVRQVRHCFGLGAFARQLMKESRDAAFQRLEPPAKERLAAVVADLVCLACMLMCNLAVREAHSLLLKGDRSVVPQLQEVFAAVGGVQREAMWWAHHFLQNMYRLQPSEYKAVLRKVLFLDPPESYSAKDNWPPEAERSHILQLISECCLLEDTLMRVLIIGLSAQLPLPPSDALDIADRLVARAAKAHTSFLPKVPTVERFELITAVLEISLYHAPPSIALPEEFSPPQLAVSKLYWKGWVLLLVLASFSPSTLGREVWAHYPTLRGLMEMVMTRTYDFPPTTTLALEPGQGREQALRREAELSLEEKEGILRYEGHLASASRTTITEKNSLMLNQVSLYAPKGPIRRIPATVLDLVKTVNRSLKLGESLSSCRSPDFLLEIVQQQGTSQSMLWLSELVESSQESVEALPVQCLCEFLLANQNQDREQDGCSEDQVDQPGHVEKFKRKRSSKAKLAERLSQLVARLRSLVHGTAATPQTSWEVLSYFVDKLSSKSVHRQQAVLKCLEVLLEQETGQQARSGLEWFLPSLLALKDLPSLENDICKSFIKAMRTVMDVELNKCLLVAIVRLTSEEGILENWEGLSAVLCERLPMIQHMLRPGGGEGRGLAGQEAGTGSDATTAVLSMMARALPVAMVCGLEVTEEGPIPDSHVAVFESVNKMGRVLPSSLLECCLQVLSCVDPSQLEGSAKRDFNKVVSYFCPKPRPLRVLGSNGSPLPLVPSPLRPAALSCPNPALVQLALADSSVMDLIVTVETFGVPASNMQMVLQMLDKMAVETPADVAKCVTDAGALAWMAGLQMERAGGGAGQALVETLRGLKTAAAPVKSEAISPGGGGAAVEDMDQTTPPADGLSSLSTDVCATHSLEQLLQAFAAKEKGARLKLLSILNRKDDGLFHELVTNLVAALRKALSDANFFALFCSNSMSVIVLKNLTCAVQSDKTLSTDLSSLLQDIQTFSCQKQLSTLARSATNFLAVLHSSVGGVLTADCVGSFKEKLRDASFDLESTACREGLSRALSREPWRGEELVRAVTAAARRRGRSLQAAALFAALLSSLAPTERRGLGGLLSDALQRMVPDLVNSLRGRQLLMSLAFTTGNDSQLVAGQQVFLTHLVHSTSWPSLHHMLTALLRQGAGSGIHPTPVLDFVSACINRPQLWRGGASREGVVNPHLSIGVVQRRVLRVTEEQLGSLVQYCLLEARQLGSEDGGGAEERLAAVLKSRVPLIFSCYGQTQEGLGWVYSALDRRLQDFPSEAHCMRSLLYLAAPQDFPYREQILSPGATTSPCVLDAHIHSLLLHLLGGEAARVAGGGAQVEAASKCCQVALMHPQLMVRHLPMVSALLKSCTSSKTSSKGDRSSQERVLGQFFAVLKHLQPAVFACGQTNGLNACLQCYFSFIAEFGGPKQESLVNSLSALLSSYLRHSPGNAVKVISANISVLREYYDACLSGKRTSVLPLIEAFSGGVASGRGSEGVGPSSPHLLVAMPTQSGLTLQQVMPYLKKLAPGSPMADVLKVLEDLEDTSRHSSDIISYFVSDLCRLLSCEDPLCCRLAHTLLRRHLLVCPRSVAEVVPLLEACLSSHHPHAVTSALDSLAEVIPLCPEKDTVRPLQKMFALATRGDVYAEKQLLRVLHSSTSHMLQ